MKIAIIGASGFAGSAILKESLDRGHHVTAIVRNPEKITVKHQNLTVLKGDVLQEHEIIPIITGKDAVISAFSPGWENPRISEAIILGNRAILDIIKKSHVKRLLVVGGAGSLLNEKGEQLVNTPQFPAAWKPAATALCDVLETMKTEKNLDWTFLSPAIMFEPGERTGKFRIGTNHPLFDEKGESKISNADLAVALIDELEKPRFIQQRFTIAY
jgi:uncharacterized protein